MTIQDFCLKNKNSGLSDCYMGKILGSTGWGDRNRNSSLDILNLRCIFLQPVEDVI